MARAAIAPLGQTGLAYCQPHHWWFGYAHYAPFELDLYGRPGRWDGSYFLVAYREGAPCPACGTAVVKIKTGSTAGYICPSCQPLETGG
jgi:hypothetical protein